jgi:septal ring factor EnvC (AmiA/AmiB activator)
MSTTKKSKSTKSNEPQNDVKIDYVSKDDYNKLKEENSKLKEEINKLKEEMKEKKREYYRLKRDIAELCCTLVEAGEKHPLYKRARYLHLLNHPEDEEVFDDYNF